MVLEEERGTEYSEHGSSRSDMANLKTAKNSADAVISSIVSRAWFSTAVFEREPVGHIGTVFPTNGDSIRTVYNFTEIESMSGQLVTYRWKRSGSAIAEVSLDSAPIVGEPGRAKN